jgi:hypothetical protein
MRRLESLIRRLLATMRAGDNGPEEQFGSLGKGLGCISVRIREVKIKIPVDDESNVASDPTEKRHW